EDTSYDIKNRNLLDRLKGVEEDKRTARFVCAIAVVMPGGESFTCTGTIEGYIGDEPMGENGFGYDPIFYVQPQGVSTAALSPEEKNAISHRGKAMRKMREELAKRLGEKA
ncbi:MAG: non-canonical purine NTP pyrophosphatase, partial [Lachnospiraceae bacterium]|nr:non-canonical purine NTP pyrophosphatase [Lachnospiraceae bacterium]